MEVTGQDEQGRACAKSVVQEAQVLGEAAVESGDGCAERRGRVGLGATLWSTVGATRGPVCIWKDH